MKKQIDTKSTLIGIVIAVLAMLAVGTTRPNGPVGRFQIGGTSEWGMVLDTTTGQVWRTHLGPGGGRVDPEATFFGQKLEADKEK
jgi:hypothetical protein